MRAFLVQFLPWIVSDSFSVSTLHHIDDSAGMIFIVYNAFWMYFLIFIFIADEIIISYKSIQGISFGVYFQQFVNWFAAQLEFNWPEGFNSILQNYN